MKKYILIITILAFCISAKAQLTAITPNQGYAGQVLNTSVTGAGIFMQSSSPSGNVYDMYLQQGGSIIYLFDWNTQWNYSINVVTPDSVDIQNFIIPGGAASGSYDLHVTTGDIFQPWINQNFYTLPAAFTIAPPDGYISGRVYQDSNLNGIQDAGELGLQNQIINIMPGNYNTYTDVNGDYSSPAYNGNYTVKWIAAINQNYSVFAQPTFNVTINNANSSGNDFGLETAITNIAINYGEIGTTVNPVITSDSLFTVSPLQVYIRKTTSPFSTIIASTSTIVNVTQLSTSFAIPFNTSLTGTYDLYVIVGSPSVTYRVPNAFTVILFSNGITGSVYFDTNGNGIKDIGELPVNNGEVELTPGNITGYSDNSGVYGFGTSNGNFTVQYQPKYYETVTSVSSYNVTVNNNVVSGNNFGVQVDPGFDSLSLYVDHWLLRCNSTNVIFIRSTNSGFGPVNGRVYFLKDPTMNYSSAIPPADYISGDTAYWNFSNLPPGQTFNVTTYYNAPGAGSNVTFHVIAAILDAGNNITFSNQRDLNCTVSCSYDPNDKRVNPPGVQTANYTLFDRDLFYTIRFQNTGNDTAFKVVVLDTLDSNLDFNTFEFISSTHEVTTELNPANGALKFTFNNILLPDSNVDEPGSNGELTYKIRCLAGLPENTEIKNTAYIIFDLNDAVITNTTLNTLVSVIPVGIDEVINTGNGVVIYPNPFDESAVIKFKNPDNEQYHLIITDIEGRKVAEQLSVSDKILLNKGNIRSGIYFYRLFNTGYTVNYGGKFIIR